MHQQLTNLRRTPRTVQFHQLDELLRRIYKPLLLLGEVDDVAAARALREHYEVAKEAAGERKSEIDRLARRFLDARGSLSHVLGTVGAGLYPALLKQVGTTLKKHELNQRRLPKDRYWPQGYNTCRANQLSQYKYKLY